MLIGHHCAVVWYTSGTLSGVWIVEFTPARLNSQPSQHPDLVDQLTCSQPGLLPSIAYSSDVTEAE